MKLSARGARTQEETVEVPAGLGDDARNMVDREGFDGCRTRSALVAYGMG
jgi:hypothetical protein